MNIQTILTPSTFMKLEIYIITIRNVVIHFFLTFLEQLLWLVLNPIFVNEVVTYTLNLSKLVLYIVKIMISVPLLRFFSSIYYYYYFFLVLIFQHVFTYMLKSKIIKIDVQLQKLSKPPDLNFSWVLPAYKNIFCLIL